MDKTIVWLHWNYMHMQVKNYLSGCPTIILNNPNSLC